MRERYSSPVFFWRISFERTRKLVVTGSFTGSRSSFTYGDFIA
jgi:hypothetical protein